MRRITSSILTLGLLLFLSGCASIYRPINPSTLNYNSHDLQDGIGISYKYGVLSERGNKKYARKEYKKNVKLIAVKITNNTESVINIGKNAAFFSGQNQIIPMEPMAIKKSIKQIVPAYLPYALLTFVNFTVTKTSSSGMPETDVYPIGYGLGPAVTFGNMAMAGSSNRDLLNELYEYNILGRDIQKDETVYGIIGVRNIGYNPLTLKMIN